MSALVLTAALLSSLSLEGDISAEGGDYVIVSFEVPNDTAEIHIEPSYPEGEDILDWGLWSPEGMRGWSGGLRAALTVGESSSSRGYLAGAITPGTWTLVIGKASIKSESVPWAATVSFRDEGTLETQPTRAFEAVTLENTKRWYAGDFHVHSLESGDASASLEGIYSAAREAGLDFVSITNHNTASGYGLEAVAQADSDDLLFIRGNEVTTYGGHGNALGYSEMIDHRVGHEGREADDIIEQVRGAGGLFSVNHPNLGLLGNCIGCGWEHSIDWSRVNAMEVHNGNYDLGITIFTPGVIEIWEEKHSEGNRIAAIGGSDDHDAAIDLESHQSPIGSPTTWVLASALSEAAILEGVEAGRTWIQLAGPNSPLLKELSLFSSSSEGEATIGDTVQGHELRVEMATEGAEGMLAILYRNGEPVADASIPANGEVSLESEIPKTGAVRFHVEVSDGLAKILSSHFYADYQAPPSSGGCQSATDHSAWSGSLLFVLLLLRRRKRASSRWQARRT